MVKHRSEGMPRRVNRKVGVVQGRKKTKLSSFLKSVKEWLTSDTFMYGPLLEYKAPSRVSSSPPPVSRGKAFGLSNGLMTEAISPRSTPVQESSSIKATNLKQSVEDTIPKPMTNVQDVHCASSYDTSNKDDEDSLTDHGDESRSFTDSQTTEFSPLHAKSAQEVAQRLVKRLGGRFSKELGIYVDILDSEVERWFLATTLFTRVSELDHMKQMFKKFQSTGISKIQDVLTVEQSELEDVFESLIHKQRMASRLQKIAVALRESYNGSICSLKQITDYAELVRELLNLPGYNRSAAQLFLRELRAVWPGVAPEVDARVRNVAKHLHLVPTGFGSPEIALLINNLAQEAGLDARDLEAALMKLSLQHAHQYKSCMGGASCNVLKGGSLMT